MGRRTGRGKEVQNGRNYGDGFCEEGKQNDEKSGDWLARKDGKKDGVGAVRKMRNRVRR